MNFKALDFLEKHLDGYVGQTMGPSGTGDWIELSRPAEHGHEFDFDSPSAWLWW